MKNNYKLGKMTIQQKIDACVGKNIFASSNIPIFDVGSVRLAYGQSGVNAGGSWLYASDAPKSVVYPSALALGASFDTALSARLGVCLAEDAHDLGIDSLIISGAHPIRSPFNGTNSYYYSEDPILSALMASSLAFGIASRRTGVLLDGYGADDAQSRRLQRNSIIDERTFNELYACGFDYILKVNKPMGVVLGYSRVNGAKLSEDETVSAQLAERSGYDALIISPPYSDTDPAAAIRAGHLPELSENPTQTAERLMRAYNAGEFTEEQLDAVILKLVKFARTAEDNRRARFMHDSEVNHSVAVDAARECFVLLKNEADTLPLPRTCELALSGEGAVLPRIQLKGRYYVNPTRTDTPEAHIKKLCNTAYYAGDCQSADFSAERLNDCTAVVLFVGSSPTEGEGIDKTSLALPEAQLNLMKTVKALGKRLILVISGGVYEMNGTELADAIIYDPLCGQGGAQALAEILFGVTSPSGRLPVTLPNRVEDIPTYKYFSVGSNDVVYQESLFMGYRYYSASSGKAAYPFGWGLTYSRFEYSELAYTGMERDGKAKFSFTLTNTGSVNAAEVIQVYVADLDRRAYKARRDLKYFERIELASGESRTISFTLTKRDFSYYDTRTHSYTYYAGRYEVQIGKSAVDIELIAPITLCADSPYIPEFGEKDIPSFLKLHSGKMTLANNEYKLLYGKELPLSEKIGALGLQSPVSELATVRRGEKLLNFIDSSLGLSTAKRRKAPETTCDILSANTRALLYDMPIGTFMRYYGKYLNYKIIRRSKPLSALLGTDPKRKKDK